MPLIHLTLFEAPPTAPRGRSATFGSPTGPDAPEVHQPDRAISVPIADRYADRFGRAGASGLRSA
jgi:hypothetical protein